MLAKLHTLPIRTNFLFFGDSCLESIEENDGRDENRISALESKFDAIDSQLKKIAAKVTAPQTNQESPTPYADALCRSQGSSSASVVTKRNAELVEKQEQEKRANNIIMYGVEEDHVGDKESEIAKDKEFVDSFLETINVRAKPKQVVRLGTKAPGKRRPIKLIMNNTGDKTEVMSNLNRLRNSGDVWNGISVREDYTAEERELIRQMSDEAKRRNRAEKVSHWKVRGTPKMGLKIVKINPRN